LKDRGVVHYDRVPYWGEPLTLGPQLNSDFNELLVELGFSATETLGHLRCKSALLRALILSGQKARNSVVELITPENHAALSDGKTVSIRVENLGDAIYLLAPIKRVINGTVTCHPQQVRQVAKKG
jgi:hypothetical protein